jgi:hypothetical protein
MEQEIAQTLSARYLSLTKALISGKKPKKETDNAQMCTCSSHNFYLTAIRIPEFRTKYLLDKAGNPYQLKHNLFYDSQVPRLSAVSLNTETPLSLTPYQVTDLSESISKLSMTVLAPLVQLLPLILLSQLV